MEDLTFHYQDGTCALDDVNLVVREGEVHAVVGRNGAGKTTLVKQITGLLKPTRGRVEVCGVDTHSARVAELALRIGTVLQDPGEQISERTVREEIGFPIVQRRRGKFSPFRRRAHVEAGVAEAVARVCTLVGIPDELLDQDPMLLPHGLRRLVVIAEALVVEPRILVLDDATNGLGASARRSLGRLIERLTQQNRAVVLVGTDVDFCAEVAHTATVLDAGRVTLQGSVGDIFAPERHGQLDAACLRPPRAAELARGLGVAAVTPDDLVATLIAGSGR